MLEREMADVRLERSEGPCAAFLPGQNSIRTPTFVRSNGDGPAAVNPGVIGPALPGDRRPAEKRQQALRLNLLRILMLRIPRLPDIQVKTPAHGCELLDRQHGAPLSETADVILRRRRNHAGIRAYP